MENKEQKIWMIITVVTITVLVFIFAGITYAFFTTSDNVGSTAEIISNSGKMLITYGDGTNTLVVSEDIAPSNKIIVDKTFSLTGTNTSEDLNMPFSVSLEFKNSFINGELEYFVKETSNNENVVINGSNIVPQDEIESGKYPQELSDYFYGIIRNSTNEVYNQEIFNGYFKPNSENETVTFNLKMMFRDNGRDQDYNKGATFNGKIVIKEELPVSEITDSWDEIATNVRNGNVSKYKIGDTKEVEIDGTSYTVRVANNSTPSECNNADFSQTACGLVFEFADIVEERQMNSNDSTSGGWPAMDLRTYANEEFFNKLPSELQNVIIDTKVVSGHVLNETSNFTSTDKIYILSVPETLEDGVVDEENKISDYETTYGTTRQLDYYKQKKVTINNSLSAGKKYNGQFIDVWTRSIMKYNSIFFVITSDNAGNPNLFFGNNASKRGFAPAFRIG